VDNCNSEFLRTKVRQAVSAGSAVGIPAALYLTSSYGKLCSNLCSV